MHVALIFYLIFHFCSFWCSDKGKSVVVNKMPHQGPLSPFHQQHTSTAGVESASVSSENFNVHFYRCEWQINPEIRFIRGKVTAYFSVNTSASSIIFDLSAALTIDSVVYHHQNIRYEKIASDGLSINLPSQLSAGQRDSVSICYHGEPRQPGSGAFTKTMHNGIPIVSTLSEPYGAREWWPCKDGLKDKADSVDIIITTPLIYTASTNGVKTKEIIAGNNVTSYWEHRYPIASYLIAIAVTNYLVLVDSVQLGNTHMPVIDYIFPESLNEFRSLVPHTKYALKLFSSLFGEYPFVKEKYGHTQFTRGGGMEHQTNTFISRANGSLMAHELAHQWFGNKITCGTWRDVWLNEGFATYLQALYDESLSPGYLARSRKTLGDLVTSKPDGSVWVNDTTSDARIFDSRLTYSKASYLVHMLRWKIGDSAFFRGCRRYLNDPRFAYNFATTRELQQILEQESGKNLSSFFLKWFTGEGYPSYSIQWAQDSLNLAYVTINQTTSHPSVSFYDMPVPVQFTSAGRDTLIVFDNTRNGESFIADIGFKADIAITDPSHNILSKSNITSKTDCSTISKDEKLPFFRIEWMQNANLWVNLKVKQINPNADSVAAKIPFYLRFSGNGSDTTIMVRNIRNESQSLILLNFRADRLQFTSPSCLFNNAYQVEKLETALNRNLVSIFPNPAADKITVSVKNPDDKTLFIELFNSSGQALYKVNMQTDGADKRIDIPLAEFPTGVYMMTVKSGRTLLMTKKILK